MCNLSSYVTCLVWWYKKCKKFIRKWNKFLANEWSLNAFNACMGSSTRKRRSRERKNNKSRETVFRILLTQINTKRIWFLSIKRISLNLVNTILKFKNKISHYPFPLKLSQLVHNSICRLPRSIRPGSLRQTLKLWNPKRSLNPWNIY